MKTILIAAVMMTGFMGMATATANVLDPYYDTLTQMNRINPAQNPQWESGANTMKSTVQDNKNKVVGSLEDIIVSDTGAIEMLNVDLNRLQLGKMSLNYREMRIKAASRSYSLSLSDREIRDAVPELLAATQTAAGADSALISVKKLAGTTVKATDGRAFGKVDKVMFDKTGNRVIALVLRVNHKTTRNKDVAIPFNSVDFQPVGSTYEILVGNDQADTILQFAAAKK